MDPKMTINPTSATTKKLNVTVSDFGSNGSSKNGPVLLETVDTWRSKLSVKAMVSVRALDVDPE